VLVVHSMGLERETLDYQNLKDTFPTLMGSVEFNGTCCYFGILSEFQFVNNLEPMHEVEYELKI
jgi:hypothetical protein